MKAFLLRFEEKAGGGRKPLASACNAADSGKRTATIVAGTKTLTEVRKEMIDDDPFSRSSLVIPTK